MRAAMGNRDIDFVAVNDLTNAATLAHLLKYDSVLGNLQADVKASAEGITVDGDELRYTARTATNRLYDAFTLEKRTGQPNRLREQLPAEQRRPKK
jgi:glyceraldehyde-3-phosphate dehydrogenase/erythrose-4-phosphate dehydrogenase